MYEELARAWSELIAPGGPFEIVVREVAGIPLRTYAKAPASVREIWRETRAFAERDYLVYRDEIWSYADAHRDVESIASWLSHEGVGVGDRVAIAMRNYPEWLLVYWATLSLGATAVGMNAWWTGPEMAFVIQDSRPRIIVCDQERLERLDSLRKDLPPLVVVAVRTPPERSRDAVPFAALTQQSIERGERAPDSSIDPDSDACIFYTSGTTGQPKGARLTHRGCVSNLMSIAFWAAVCERARSLSGPGSAVGSPPRTPRNAARPGVVSLVTTPLFHVTANNCVAYSVTAAGGALVLMYKWDAGEALRLIEQERVTNFTGVPTMTRELLSHADFDAFDTSSLQLMGGGGAPFQPDLVEKVEAIRGGTRPNTGYGLTETCGIITTTSADYHVDAPESVGPVMPCFEARCVDAAGRVLATGQVGELQVKGAQVIAGYLNRPDATREAICEGWFRTGDVARIDDHGFVTIVDRIKDMLLRGGENVYCSEVETILFEHPDIVECAVFGVADPRLGEEVAAAIVVRNGSGLTAARVRDHCEGRIARHKIPRYLWLRAEPLPRNANGKFMKKTLRDELALADAE